MANFSALGMRPQPLHPHAVRLWWPPYATDWFIVLSIQVNAKTTVDNQHHVCYLDITINFISLQSIYFLNDLSQIVETIWYSRYTRE